MHKDVKETIDKFKLNYFILGSTIKESAWSFFADNGIVEESCFPYSSGSGTVEACRETFKNEQEWKTYNVTDFQSFKTPEDIREEISTHGPVNTAFNAA